jgi:large subunit ribosomal protein L15
MANELSSLAPCKGEKRARVRVGRGEGSGLGKTAGRGTKGAKSRAGYTHRAYFEGGQMPLHRRLPKRGFKSPFAKEYTIVQVGSLSTLPAGSEVDELTLVNAGLVRKVAKDGVKILGGGEITVALNLRVSKVSESAAAKIVAAGGQVLGA